MKKLITIILFSICFSRVDDASCAKIFITDVDCRIQADGYIGGLQMTLAHGADFSINLTDNAMVAEYRTDGNETILIIVVPENDILFTYSGEFQIVDLLIANSSNLVSTECSDYNWSPDFTVTQTDVYGNIISYDENDWLMPEDTGMINTISIPYPNPSISDGTMNVMLSIAEESQVTLTAYNQSGIPYIIINDNFIAGAHIISFELEDGFYHCIFESGDSYIEGDIQFGDLILGCTNQYACNYDEDAINDDNSCLYNDCNGECDGDATFDCSGECNGSDFSCGGCTDEDACNYDEDALLNDGSCINDFNGDDACNENVLSIDEELIPTNYNINTIYPNPFNPITTISFSIPEFGLATITSYNINGRKLETLTNEVLSIGNYSINWNASSYPSGVYLIRMDSGDFTQTQKVLLVK